MCMYRENERERIVIMMWSKNGYMIIIIMIIVILLIIVIIIIMRMYISLNFLSFFFSFCLSLPHHITSNTLPCIDWLLC